MPLVRKSSRFRKFRHRFGVAAPRVVIRTHWPLRWKLMLWAGGVILFCVLAGVFASVFDSAALAGEGVRRELELQRRELVLLRSTAGTGENAVVLERVVQQQLLAKIDSLERENAALKEDVRLFERLVPVVASESQVKIGSFRVLPIGESRYRYQLLLAFQSDRQTPDFKGRLQVIVDYVGGGGEGRLVLPDGRDSAGYPLEIRHFVRREGEFVLPVGRLVKSVEVRILQGDAVRARQLAQL